MSEQKTGARPESEGDILEQAFVDLFKQPLHLLETYIQFKEAQHHTQSPPEAKTFSPGINDVIAAKQKVEDQSSSAQPSSAETGKAQDNFAQTLFQHELSLYDSFRTNLNADKGLFKFNKKSSQDKVAKLKTEFSFLQSLLKDSIDIDNFPLTSDQDKLLKETPLPIILALAPGIPPAYFERFGHFDYQTAKHSDPLFNQMTETTINRLHQQFKTNFNLDLPEFHFTAPALSASPSADSPSETPAGNETPVKTAASAEAETVSTPEASTAPEQTYPALYELDDTRPSEPAEEFEKNHTNAIISAATLTNRAHTEVPSLKAQEVTITAIVKAIRDRIKNPSRYLSLDSHDDLYDWLKQQKLEPPEKSAYPRTPDGQIDDLTLLRALDFQQNIQESVVQAPIAYYRKISDSAPAETPIETPAPEAPPSPDDRDLSRRIQRLIQDKNGPFGQVYAQYPLDIPLNEARDRLEKLSPDAPTAQQIAAYQDLKTVIGELRNGTQTLTASQAFTELDSAIDSYQASLTPATTKPETEASEKVKSATDSETPLEYPEYPSSPTPEKTKTKTAILAGYEANAQAAAEIARATLSRDVPIPGLLEGYWKVTANNPKLNWAQKGLNYIADIGRWGADEFKRFYQGKETRFGRIVERSWFKNVFLFSTKEFAADILNRTGTYMAQDAVVIARDKAVERYWAMSKAERKALRQTAKTQFKTWGLGHNPHEKAIRFLTIDEIEFMKGNGQIAELTLQKQVDQQILERFSQDKATWEDMVHKGAGESLKTLEQVFDNDQAKIKAFRTEIAEIFNAYAVDSSYPESYLTEQIALVLAKELPFQADAPDFKDKLIGAEYYASSFKDLAENYRNQRSHFEGVAAIAADLETVEMRFGLAAPGERTAAEKLTGEKILAKLESVGVNPVTATVAAGMVTAAIDLFTFSPGQQIVSGVGKSLLGAIAAPLNGVTTASPLIVGVAVNGIFKYLREKSETTGKVRGELRRTETDQSLIAVDEKQADKDKQGREGLNFLFTESEGSFLNAISENIPRKSANTLTRQLRSFYDNPSGGDAKLRDLTPDEQKSAIEVLTTAKAYVTVSDKQGRWGEGGIGLVTYDSKGTLEQERTQLDLAIVRLRQDLTAKIPADSAITGQKPAAEYLNNLTALKVKVIEGSAPRTQLSSEQQAALDLKVSLDQAKQEISKAIKVRAGKKAVKSALLSAVIGEGMLEIGHAGETLSGHLPDAKTPLQMLMSNVWKISHSQIDTYAPPAEMFDPDTHLRIPEGSSLHNLNPANGDTLDLKLPNGTIIHDFADPSGHRLIDDTTLSNYHLSEYVDHTPIAIGQPHEVILNNGEKLALPGQNWHYNSGDNSITVDFDPNNDYAQAKETFPLDANGHFHAKHFDQLKEFGVDVRNTSAAMDIQKNINLPGEHDGLTLTAHVPQGTKLVEDHGTYDLVDVKTNETLVDGIRLSPTGAVLNQSAIQDQLDHHHYALSWIPGSENPDTESLSGNGLVDIRAGNLDPSGEASWWNYYRNILRDQLGREPSNAEVNTAYKLLRGYDEHDVNGGLGSYIDNTEPGTENVNRVVHYRETFEGHQSLVAAPQAENMYFKDVPAVLTHHNPQALAKLVGLTDDAIKAVNDGTKVDDLPDLQRIAYTIGYLGGEHQVPSEEDVLKLLNFMGAETTTTAGSFDPAELSITSTDQSVDWSKVADTTITGTSYAWNPSIVEQLDGVDIFPVAVPTPFEHQKKRKTTQIITSSDYPSEYQDSTNDYYDNIPYDEYPEYSKNEVGDYSNEYFSELVPTFEKIFDHLALTEAEKTTLRKTPASERLNLLYEKSGYIFPETVPFFQSVNDLQILLDTKRELVENSNDQPEQLTPVPTNTLTIKEFENTIGGQENISQDAIKANLESYGFRAILTSNEFVPDKFFEKLQNSPHSPDGYIVGAGIGNIFNLFNAYKENLPPKGLVSVDTDLNVILQAKLFRHCLQNSTDFADFKQKYFPSNIDEYQSALDQVLAEETNPKLREFFSALSDKKEQGFQHQNRLRIQFDRQLSEHQGIENSKSNVPQAIEQHYQILKSLAQQNKFAILYGNLANQQFQQSLRSLPDWNESNNVIYLSNVLDHLTKRWRNLKPAHTWQTLNTIQPTNSNKRNTHVYTFEFSHIDYTLLASTETPVIPGLTTQGVKSFQNKLSQRAIFSKIKNPIKHSRGDEGIKNRHFLEKPKQPIPEQLIRPAARLYEISRDIYGPIIIRTANQLIEKVKTDPENTVVACTGRDSLPIFIVAQRMINSSEDPKIRALAKNVKYFPVSRKLTTDALSPEQHKSLMAEIPYDSSNPVSEASPNYEENRKKLDQFMTQLDLNRHQKIIIADIGARGTTQNALKQLYPDKNIEGIYLTTYPTSKDPEKGSKAAILERRLHNRGFQITEDLWNGLFESTTELSQSPAGVMQMNRDHIQFRGPNNSELLSPQIHRELLFKIAFQGLVDAVRVNEFKQTFDIPEESFALADRRYHEWLQSITLRSANPTDLEIVDSLVRKPTRTLERETEKSWARILKAQPSATDAPFDQKIFMGQFESFLNSNVFIPLVNTDNARAIKGDGPIANARNSILNLLAFADVNAPNWSGDKQTAVKNIIIEYAKFLIPHLNSEDQAFIQKHLIDGAKNLNAYHDERLISNTIDKISSLIQGPKFEAKKTTTPEEVKNTVMDPDFSIDFGKDANFRDLTEAEKINQVIHDNKTFGLNYFIKTAREHLKLTSSNEEWRTQSSETKWLSNLEVTELAQKYGISMAFTFVDRHARVLTKPPVANSDGSYAVTVYDPFHDGEQTLTITPDEKNVDTFIFTTNDLTRDGSGVGNATHDFNDVINRLQKANYDLSIPIIPGKEYLAKAKQGALQTDGYNCTLWSLFYAAMANAMRPGYNTFKGVGLEKWQQDYGFTLRTYESVTGKPPVAIKFGELA